MPNNKLEFSKMLYSTFFEENIEKIKQIVEVENGGKVDAKKCIITIPKKNLGTIKEYLDSNGVRILKKT